MWIVPPGPPSRAICVIVCSTVSVTWKHEDVETLALTPRKIIFQFFRICNYCHQMIGCTDNVSWLTVTILDGILTPAPALHFRRGQTSLVFLVLTSVCNSSWKHDGKLMSDASSDDSDRCQDESGKWSCCEQQLSNCGGGATQIWDIISFKQYDWSTVARGKIWSQRLLNIMKLNLIASLLSIFPYEHLRDKLGKRS